MALAGGVNVLLNPAGFIGFSQASMLSRRGRCAAFSADADGFVRAEGAGVVVLKPLADAVAAGDRIHGVIAAHGSNCDGRTMGLALPSARAQEDLLRRVYERAGIPADEVVYVEAHGTGTQVGDAAECMALGRVLGAARSVGPLPIGSVKSNVGHLEPASGMAGLFKALAVLRYGAIPASLHLEPLNPGIDFAGLGLAPVGRARPLASGEGRCFVGVNSFGFGGANAHVVVGPPPAAPPTPDVEVAGDLPVIASGRTAQAAEEAARRLAARLTGAAPQEFYDIAATAGVRRARHRYRRVALASTPCEAAAILSDESVTGEAVEGGRVGLVFAGNGSQWAGMAADLLDGDPVFRAEVEAVDTALAPRLGWSVAGALRRPADEWGLEATEVAQPLLFAVQAGIVAVLREPGVRWTVALGHSVGEVAAAYAVGALTLQEAAWVVAERSRAQALTAGQGRMAAVGLSSAEAEEALSAFPGLIVAAVNSARDVTVAGPVNQLKSLGDELASREAFFRLMDLDHAFHSPAMERVRGPLTAGLEGLAPRGSTRALISTVTGAARYPSPAWTPTTGGATSANRSASPPPSSTSWTRASTCCWRSAPIPSCARFCAGSPPDAIRWPYWRPCVATQPGRSRCARRWKPCSPPVRRWTGHAGFPAPHTWRSCPHTRGSESGTGAAPRTSGSPAADRDGWTTPCWANGCRRPNPRGRGPSNRHWCPGWPTTRWPDPWYSRRPVTSSWPWPQADGCWRGRWNWPGSG